MTEILIASTEADARAVAAVEEHHAEMAGRLHLLTETFLRAAGAADSAATAAARYELVAWCDTELLPHARAEEQALYPAAHAIADGRFLVDAMLGEHEDIGRLVQPVASTSDLVGAIGAATTLRAVFDSHLAKENDLLLPLVARTPGISLAELVDGVHGLLGETDDEAAGCSGHTCACGEEDPASQRSEQG